MKKGLLVLLLAVALVAPLFAAEKGDMEIVGKLGVAVDHRDGFDMYDKYGEIYYLKNNPALSIALEGFYYLLPELPVGLGINYRFNSERIKKGSSDAGETGATNIYLTVKPTAKIDSKIFTALYAIGQIGYGLYRIDGDYWEEDEIESNGLYWGLGAGAEIMNNFVVEFVFSTNYWSYKDKYYSSKEDMRSTALTFFAGYKFNI